MVAAGAEREEGGASASAPSTPWKSQRARRLGGRGEARVRSKKSTMAHSAPHCTMREKLVASAAPCVAWRLRARRSFGGGFPINDPTCQQGGACVLHPH